MSKQTVPQQNPEVKPIVPQRKPESKPEPKSGGDNQLIITALKKYIQIVNEIKQLRNEMSKREEIRQKLAPMLMEYMDKVDQKKIKTNQDTLTYTTYKTKEGYSKKSVQRIAYQFFQNQRKAEEFVAFCEKKRQVIERQGIKHTKPRVRKTKIVKKPKKEDTQPRK